MKPRFLNIRYSVWLIMPLIVYGLYLVLGLPHVIWSRTWIDAGQGLDPFASRHYTQCSYVGYYGSKSIAAINGKCRLVIFYKQEDM
uniref:Uncharacterized protein n=1 Tax=OCS116 cluster bacterium TaxID=2030921 RepID=A0A2A4Z0J5_9PROT